MKKVSMYLIADAPRFAVPKQRPIKATNALSGENVAANPNPKGHIPKMLVLESATSKKPFKISLKE